MDLDIFFNSQRWKILQIIAKKPSSPSEIAEHLKTSIAYVSQQLKLLEATDFIYKERTGSAEKGKPRSLYTISKELMHLTILTKDNSEKKVIFLSDYHKAILKIWLIENTDLHYYIEKLYWRIEENLNEIKKILLHNSKIIIVTNSKSLKQKIDSFLRETDKKIEVEIMSEENFKKSSLQGHSIYDSLVQSDRKVVAK